MTGKFTGVLADFGAADLASVGGKGANLGELARRGFPVPPGFLVTTAAYATVLAETGLGAELERLLEADDAGAQIRSLFTEARIPAAVTADIAAAYAALGGGPVAVRSSATAEDLPGAAFAGQQDTFLNVAGEQAVIRAVAECWASLWTDRAIAYRQCRGIDPREVSIAVVVQDMVAADTAGVLFSANPVTGERGEIVVDASTGLGEAVVSGRVTPDHYVLDRTGRIRSFTPGAHEVVIRALAGGGTGESAGTSALQSALGKEQLAELARLALHAQEHFGRPQDMEWAIAGGRLYVLRARPMTALPPEPMHLNPFQRIVGPFFVEMFQVRPYPLDVSGWMQRGILAMLHSMAGSVGVVFPSVQELLPEAETRTSQANRALEELADEVRSHGGGLARAFAELAPHELLSRLEHDPEFNEFHARFQVFLAEYGHRETLSVVMSSSPTWSDAPDVVLGLIISMMGERRPAADQTGQALAELKRHPALRITALRRHLLSAVDAAKAGIAFREDSHFYATMVLPPLRRALSELGRRLCDAGVLVYPAEVHHLRFEELAGMDDGGALPPEERERYRRLVLARAAKRRELEGIPLLDPAALFARRRPAPGTLVSGMPASRGQAAGAVRIIRGPDEFGLLRSGEILVCPYTNPSWTPLFQRDPAVVVDAGGIAFHAAIVAREYGIPAVMGTGSGTSTLQDGQLILVDGTRGQVTAAAAAPPP